MAFGDKSRTDVGTAVLHAVLLGSFCVLLMSGLRIASDDPEAAWLAFLDPILPIEHLWYRHLVAGIVLAGTLVGYGVYVARARLRARMRFDQTRLMAIWRGGEARYAALNVAAVWILIAFLVIEIVTGAAIFWGSGEGILDLHRVAAWMGVACVVVHVALQASYGGIQQLLRILRPSRLRVPDPPPNLAELLVDQLEARSTAKKAPAKYDDVNSVRAHPVANALGVVLLVIGIASGSEQLTRPVLKIVAISKEEAPLIDGDLSDPAWVKAQLATVLTTQGGDFGGTHESRVEIRALHDGEFAYFAFTWEDPTRSLKHMPLLKNSDGWQVVATDPANEDVYNEDKFAVLVSPSVFPLIGAAIHLAKAPLTGKPGGSSGRGLHYTLDGTLLDVWLWRASHQGAKGHVDNCHISGPRNRQGEDEVAYAGGFALDPGPRSYEENYPSRASLREALHPLRLPRDVAAMKQVLGRISDETSESESEHARWWISDSESIPYSLDVDATIPVGTIVPGVIMFDEGSDQKNRIIGFGRWAAGRWTLEIMRRLKTGSAYDIELKSGVLMWVAAFDHSAKRHTRHLRPFRLQLE
jgi:Ethylbenzene dehydrogenase/Prokaryotic cytochrome b561